MINFSQKHYFVFKIFIPHFQKKVLKVKFSRISQTPKSNSGTFHVSTLLKIIQYSQTTTLEPKVSTNTVHINTFYVNKVVRKMQYM